MDFESVRMPVDIVQEGYIKSAGFTVEVENSGVGVTEGEHPHKSSLHIVEPHHAHRSGKPDLIVSVADTTYHQGLTKNFPL